MLFRPKFCANCGEKIERTDWGILTSRRFCPVCESEFKGQDLIPKVLVVGATLFGLFGFATYLRSGGNDVAAKQPKQVPAQLVAKPEPSTVANNLPVQQTNGTASMTASRQQQMPEQPATHDPPVQRTVATEPAYICGAETKKGTPCSRRVKGNVRCFQHQGMPAMLPPDKLKAG